MSNPENLSPSPELLSTSELCGDAVIDSQIIDAVRKYYEKNLVNDGRAQFKQKSFKDKVDEICYAWGERAETWEDSADLKGLLFTRSMARLILQNPDVNVVEDKHIPLPVAHEHQPSRDRDYWLRVIETFELHLEDFVLRNGGTYFPQASQESQNGWTDYALLANVLQYSIYRRDLISIEGASIHAEYLARHDASTVAE